MENQDYIILSKEQIAVLVEQHYLSEESLVGSTECRLHLKEDVFLWTNMLDIIYPNGRTISYLLNLHNTYGLSLDELLRK